MRRRYRGRARRLVLPLALVATGALLTFNASSVSQIVGAWPGAGAVAEAVLAGPVADTLGLEPPVGRKPPGQPYCDPRKPTFVYGFAALKLQLGARMGEPLECEQAIHASGDTRQRTTTGYAYYRKGVNTPAFTNGTDHWALTDRGLVYWAGDVVDPPGVARTRGR